MKFCQICGAEIVDQAVICPNCGSPVAPQKHNKMGIASFVLALVGIVTSYITAIASISGLCNLLAIIFGIIGIVQAKRNNEKKGFAVAGLIISLLGVILFVMFLIFFLFFGFVLFAAA